MFGEPKNSFPVMIIGPQFLGYPYRGLVNIQTELSDSILIFVIVISIINFSYFERLTGNETNIYQIPIYIYIYIYVTSLGLGFVLQ